MTITEFMNELEVESATAAFEMTCESAMCDFYADYAEINEVNDYAAESLSLAFDENDDFNAEETAPATEGILASIGNKFKQVIGNIKGWFEKMAKAIKEWITKYVERIKAKIAHNREMDSQRKLADAVFNSKFELEDIDNKIASIDKKIAELEKKYNKDDTSSNEKKHITEQIDKLNADKKALAEKRTNVNVNLVISKAKVFADKIKTGLNEAERQFDSASNYETMLKDMMMKIMTSKVNPNDKKSNTLVQDTTNKITTQQTGIYKDRTSLTKYDETVIGDNAKRADVNAAKAALTGLKTDSYQKNLDNATSQLEKIATRTEAAVDAVTSARDELVKAINGGNLSAYYKTFVKSKITIPFTDITKRAENMAKQCLELRSQADALNSLFSTNSAGNAVDDAKKPAISKVLSTYSSVASQLIKIANNFLKIGTLSEAVAGA